MSGPFRHSLRVRYAECDPQGVVFNGNYLHYFDIAVTELYREALGGWNEIQPHGLEAVVAEASVRYLRPLHFDDQIVLAVGVERIGDSSMALGLTVERDGERCAEGSLRYVFVDAQERSKRTIPEAVRDPLSRFSAP